MMQECQEAYIRDLVRQLDDANSCNDRLKVKHGMVEMTLG